MAYDHGTTEAAQALLLGWEPCRPHPHNKYFWKRPLLAADRDADYWVWSVAHEGLTLFAPSPAIAIIHDRKVGRIT